MENLLFFYNLGITISMTIIITCLSVIYAKQKDRRSKLLLIFFIVLLADNTIMYVSEYSMSFSNLYDTTDWIYVLIYLVFISVIVCARFLIQDFTKMNISKIEWAILICSVAILTMLNFTIEYETAEMLAYSSVYLGMIYLIVRVVLYIRTDECMEIKKRKLYYGLLSIFFFLSITGIYETVDFYRSYSDMVSGPMMDFLDYRNIAFDVMKIVMIVMIARYIIQFFVNDNSSVQTLEDKIETFTNKYELTRRQKEILALMINGDSNKEISEKLFITEGTVKNHVYNIFQKTEVTSRNQLIKMVLYDES